MFDDPAFDPVRRRCLELAEMLRDHGPFEPHRSPPSGTEPAALPSPGRSRRTGGSRSRNPSFHRTPYLGERPPRHRDETMATVTQYSAANLIADAKVDPDRWSRVPDEATIERTVGAIEARNVRVVRAATADEARQALLDLIPEGAEVMNGSSTTLNEIGYEQLLKANPKGWRDYHAVITAENDEQKRRRSGGRGAPTGSSRASRRSRTGSSSGATRPGAGRAWPYAPATWSWSRGQQDRADPRRRPAGAGSTPCRRAAARKGLRTSSEIGKVVSSRRRWPRVGSR